MRAFAILVLGCVALVSAVVNAASVATASSADSAEALAQIGSWDGTTETAELAGPYEDPLQQEIPFGRRSFYLTPWRAYMDTWPVSRYLECLGVNWQVSAEDAEATATVLAAAGVRSARVEIGWGSFTYDDPSKLPPEAERRLTRLLQTLQRHGMRPLMLLNAHHGVPCPMKSYRTAFAQAAAKGDRVLVLADAKPVIPFYSGPMGLTDYIAAQVIITRVDRATGRCELSAPLPRDVKAGDTVDIAILRFQPFSGTVFADGTPNPAAQETLDGWLQYVAGLSAVARRALASKDPNDCGFDLEVWNEYTFGSNFLDDRHYYDPPRKYRDPIRYTAHGLTRDGCEIILPMTVDYVNGPAHQLPGVGVLSGFANQRPWENGTEMWPGQFGFSRHYYTGIDPTPLTPKTAPYQNSGPLNARGTVDGTSDGKDWHTVIPGSFFIPALRIGMPERWHYAYQTEFMTRDVQPFPGPWAQHYRFSHPVTGRRAQVWMTEFNIDRSAWTAALMKQTACKAEDPRLIRLMHAVGAKATLRTFVFQSHKGIQTIDLFAPHGGDLSIGLLPDGFFKALAEDKHELTDRVRAQIGPQVEVLTRLHRFMRAGEPVDAPRKLTVAKLVEHRPRLVFKGDGTPEHPDRFNRDDFACLPSQMAAGRFAIAYYVVTRNIVHDWNPAKDVFDPDRYQMPEQTFDVTLDNVRGCGPALCFWDRAKVTVWDPMTDQTTPVQVLAATRTSLSVHLPTTDYPRFLIIDEGTPGPLIIGPRLKRNTEPALVQTKIDDVNVRVEFSTNHACRPVVSWGPVPGRSRNGSVALPRGTRHRCLLPGLPADCGVRISCEHAGIQARWPMWDWDVQGVLSWAQTPATVALVLRHFPALPATAPPGSWTARLPAGLAWQPTRSGQRLRLGDKDVAVDVAVELLPLAPDQAMQALPSVGVQDRLDLGRQDLAGTPAWYAELHLDRTAHPGETQLRQRFRLVPMRDGLLVLSFKGSDAGFGAQATAMDGVVAGIAVTP